MKLLKRALLAAPCIALGFFFLFRAGGSVLGVVGMALLGYACMLTGAIILAFPLADLLAEPLGKLFYPGQRFDRPQPMYGAIRTRLNALPSN